MEVKLQCQRSHVFLKTLYSCLNKSTSNQNYLFLLILYSCYISNIAHGNFCLFVICPGIIAGLSLDDCPYSYRISLVPFPACQTPGRRRGEEVSLLNNTFARVWNKSWGQLSGFYFCNEEKLGFMSLAARQAWRVRGISFHGVRMTEA